MNTITLTGWETGFDKIGLNKLLRDQFGYSLRDAKAAVDALLENQVIKLSIAQSKSAFVSENLAALHVHFTVS